MTGVLDEGVVPRAQRAGFFGSRERSERGFFRAAGEIFSNSTTFLWILTGFSPALQSSLCTHPHEASHEWVTQEMMHNISMVEFSSSYM